jgi:selenocysteine lyase/cysteine desulfurase
MRGPSDLLAWRDEFPAVGNMVFLGSHTLAPLSRRARAAINQFLDVWETKASAERVWFEDVIPEMRRLESLYAHLVGADAAEVALTPSVSTGLSSLASALDFDGGRNEIVLARDEFPTDCHVWLAQERRGATVCWVYARDEVSLAAAVSERTRVVSASRVSYLDGFVLDAAVLSGAARTAGAFSIIDDYHGSGVVPVDVHVVGCDALVGGPLKYLLGGPGVAFLYVRADLIEELAPTATGWFSQRDFFAFDGAKLDWPDTAQRFALGTPSPAAIYAAAAGLDIVLEVGVDRIRSRVLELTDYLMTATGDRGYRVRTPREHARRGGVVAIEVADSHRALDTLLADGVVVDERHGALRVSPHFFTSEDDLDALLAAMARLDIAPST